MRQLGRIGLKTLAYTVVVSSIAVFIGVGIGQRGASRRGLARPSCAPSCRRAPIAPAQAPAAGATGVDFLVQSDPQQRHQGDGRRRHAGGDGVRAVPRHRPGADQDRGGARLRGRAAGTLRRRHAPARPGHPHRAGRRGVSAVHPDRAPRLRRAAAARWYVAVVVTALALQQFVRLFDLGALARRHERRRSSIAPCGRPCSPRSPPHRATPRCRPRCRWPRRTCTCRRR